MQFRLSFSELQGLIYTKTGKSVTFSCNDTHSIRVGYDVHVLLKTSNVGIDLTVEQVDNSGIRIAYSGGMGIEFMVKQALERIKGQPGADMLEALPGNRLQLHLDKNDQLNQILQRVTLKDITFDPQFATIEFSPKI